MKVLMASWSWYPVGGDWTYVENMKRLYEENGMEVIPFSTKHEKNLPYKNDKYFVKGYDYKDLNRKKSLSSGIKALKNSVVSFEALRNIDRLLDEHDIAFAHLHIIHHWVTPAIIWKLKRRGIPIIWTLHEYKLICPEGTFVSNGKVCEKCYGGKFYNCAINKCKKQSFLGSSLASLDAYLYNSLNIYNKVDAFLCPSEFLLNKFKQFGFPTDKLNLTNLCYDIEALDRVVKEAGPLKTSSEEERFILYVGRIEKLKGVKTLIEAVEGTSVYLKIAGTGAALDEFKRYVLEKHLDNIQFLGFQPKEKVYELTLKSVCVVVPSEWYENYPFSVIESLLLSKPVVGSRIGGIPELVINNKTGLLHTPGDFLDLREKLLCLWNDEGMVLQMGAEARRFAYSKVNFATHWKIIHSVIESLPLDIKKLKLANCTQMNLEKS
jgi:glycosyltransferase involved in cell wall biosynthesis